VRFVSRRSSSSKSGRSSGSRREPTAADLAKLGQPPDPSEDVDVVKHLNNRAILYIKRHERFATRKISAKDAPGLAINERANARLLSKCVPDIQRVTIGGQLNLGAIQIIHEGEDVPAPKGKAA